jgi:ribose 5-phosphate isomerase B
MHNNANVVIFGGRTMEEGEVIKFMNVFLNENFEGGRHKHRIEKIEKLEGRIKRNNGGKG